MRVYEFINEQELNEAINFKQVIAGALIASSLGSFVLAKRYIPASLSPEDQEMTKIGQKYIQELPSQITRKLGDTSNIVFKVGIPEGSSDNFVCEVEPGTRVVWVNPKYENTMRSVGYSTGAHELTHIAQNAYTPSMVAKIPKNIDTDDPRIKYEGLLGNANQAAKILQTKRAAGDRMWDHSDEAQAAIVQNWARQTEQLKLAKSGKITLSQADVNTIQNNLKIFYAYIQDMDSM